MNSLTESIIYYSVKVFGAFIRFLPLNMALAVGRMIGFVVYHLDIKHKALVYANLKIAFAKSKTPHEIKMITKSMFRNYGQNLMELLRLPLMNTETFKKYVAFEGRDHIEGALKQGKGVILVAMHYGSWELASLASSQLDHPYKVIVKPQKRFSRLDDLLNSYRECGGTVVIERGMGTRELIKSLKKNEIVALVVDQGGKDGVLVPFFNRQASMSSGAIRISLKLGIPICFGIIIRQKGPNHRLIIHKPFPMERTDDFENDVKVNLKKVVEVMEKYVHESPSEYMWFYKIWKYSKEAVIVILNDGRTGHLRQSQTIAQMLQNVLAERNIRCTTKILNVAFKSKLSARLMAILSVFANDYIYQGRLGFMRWFLTRESFDQLTSLRGDFLVSCGSSSAAVNILLANDYQAKSLVILKPGLLSFNRFDLAFLPQHDKSHRWSKKVKPEGPLVITRGAPNLISRAYLTQQSDYLLNRFSHLKNRNKLKIGLLLGGDTKNYILTEQRVRMVVHQMKEAAEALNADILVTTSRRTSARIEGLLFREMKKYPRCSLLIPASRHNVPEAVGGILGLSDIVIVSGESISMVSEAASSGKNTIVFPLQTKRIMVKERNKHYRFVEMLNAQGYILSTDEKHIKQSILNIAKQKIQTRILDDNTVILNALRRII